MMTSTRRGFLGMLSGLAAAVTLNRSAPPAHKIYGFMDVDSSIARGFHPAKVTVNGVDVSLDCPRCNDREGWADVWVKPYEVDYETDSPRFTRLYGHVIFTPNVEPPRSGESADSPAKGSTRHRIGKP